VDGGLVGGASLKSREFVEIVKAIWFDNLLIRWW
jgi:triosephosphate isomerase